jgi:hypothetical protein
MSPEVTVRSNVQLTFFPQKLTTDGVMGAE